MTASIYVIRNTISNKLYVGIAIDPQGRWSKHKWNANSPNGDSTYLHRSMAKHGTDNFTFMVIDEVGTWEEAVKKEHELISMFKSMGRLLYNCTEGGDGPVKLEGSTDNVGASTRAALAIAKQEGRHVGRIPFGFIIDEQGKLKECSKDGWIRKRVLELRNDDRTYKQISKMTFKEGGLKDGKPLTITLIERICKTAENKS